MIISCQQIEICLPVDCHSVVSCIWKGWVQTAIQIEMCI